MIVRVFVDSVMIFLHLSIHKKPEEEPEKFFESELAQYSTLLFDNFGMGKL